MPDVFIQSFTHLENRPHADQALHTLKRIASLVKPIMRKHGWVLPVLSEFFPDNPNLLGLNVNAGEKILVRLRPPFSPDTFLPEEDIVQTMLHELTHNVHGPHDEKFYKFLSGIQEEYNALQRSGYAGEGFFSEGKRLGTTVSHNVPPHMARAKALEAAEKRRQISRVLGSGGRLGSAWTTGRNLSPREAAAQAAERRARDEKTCGSGKVAEEEVAKAGKESVENKVDIDLTLSGSDDEVIIVDKPPTAVAGPSKVAIPQSSKTAVNTALPKVRNTKFNIKSSTFGSNPQSTINGTREAVVKPAASRSSIPLQKLAPTAEWLCPQCTLINIATALQCDACLMTRPTDPNVGWDCLTCGKVGMPNDFWTCSMCGTVKAHS